MCFPTRFCLFLFPLSLVFLFFATTSNADTSVNDVVEKQRHLRWSAQQTKNQTTDDVGGIDIEQELHIIKSLFQGAYGDDYKHHFEEFTKQQEASNGMSRDLRADRQSSSRRGSFFRGCTGRTERPLKLSYGNNFVHTKYRGNVCMVLKVAKDGSMIEPVARSYDNGNFQLTGAALALKPTAKESRFSAYCWRGACLINVPRVSSPLFADFYYALYSFDNKLDDQASMARFLEQATFGTRRQDLEIMQNEFKNDIEKWVQWQMYQVPLTSHREWYRQRTNPRLDIPILAGNGGPHPCKKNSRWRRFAFSVKDTGHYLTVISYNNDNQYPYLIMVDGIPRTFSNDFAFSNSALDIVQDNLFGEPMEICQSQAYFEESVGRTLAVRVKGSACVHIRFGNPAIDLSVDETIFTSMGELVDIGANAPTFMSPIDDTVYEGRAAFTNFDSGDEYILTTDLDSETCESLGKLTWGPFIKGMFPDDHGTGSIYLIYEEHLVFVENTPQNHPADGGGATTFETDGSVQCANVVRNFLNEDTCTLSHEKTACAASTPPEFTIALNSDTINAFYDTSGRYVYAIENLPLIDTFGTHANYLYRPCQRNWNRPSRWLQVDRSNCEGDYRIVQDSTETSIVQLLKLYDNPNDINVNPKLRDIRLRPWLPCDMLDEELYDLGHVLDSTNDDCWRHVHPLHWNVYDFTEWVNLHPGGPDAIKQWAESGSAVLTFPNSHHEDGNERFYTNIVNNPKEFTLLGRFGDTIPYFDIPARLQSNELEMQYTNIISNPIEEGILVCGSDGEVANDPTLGSGFDVNTFVMFANGKTDTKDTTDYNTLQRQRNTVWTMLALFSEDQLRQRVAWALSQILVVAPDALSEGLSTEANLNYYDIFVRHAFGSYRDILKEVSFNFNMGEMLSSINNRSFQYSLDTLKIHAYPDENYAREIMQLFTIGLYKLNPDGTPIVVDGKTQEVYTTEDILSGARAWTGFEWPEQRGNVENRWIRLDPMSLRTAWRDEFPKLDLYGGFIGDRYPLCIDQPDQQFLKKGATYRLLGSNPKPELLTEHSSWENDPLIIRLSLDENEELATILCSPSGQGEECTFPAKVVLDHTVACGTVTCDVGSVRTIKVASNPIPVYYEYVRPPCVEQAFYENAVRINDYTEWDYRSYSLMCADPRRDVASEACCVEGWEAILDLPPIEPGWNQLLNRYGYGYRYCHFNGERMTYARAQQRCSDNGQEQCQYGRIQDSQGGACIRAPWSGVNFHWTNAACSVMVKIAPNGKIAIVHDPTPDYTGRKPVPDKVSTDTLNYFVTPWNDGSYPTIDNGCETLDACTIVEDACLCSTTTVEGPQFTSQVPSRTTILDTLFIGAVHPDVSDLDYTMISCDEDGVDVYVTTGGSCNNLDETTIFHVVDDNGIDQWLKNMFSTVYVTDESYSFRNPVHFISLVDPEKRDAYHEIDAVLDQYFYHPNHPPFLATRMIQRFGISNPSPSFVLAVATAYRTGEYKSNGVTFGDGKYGDMGALVAAILLHSESRSVALDADPTYGSLKEPLLKVIGYMRNMDYVHYAPLAVPVMSDLIDRIGQGSHDVESVFSFFLPEYSPPGLVGTAGLVSPEAQVLTSSKVVTLVEGLFALTKHGLTYCVGRSSLTGWFPGAKCKYPIETSGYAGSIGYLSYTPSESVVTASDLVDELALLMTSSRLRPESRILIANAIEEEYMFDVSRAVMIAQQLILTTPEFHGTTMIRNSDVPRTEPPEEEADDKEYKAVIYLFFAGGMDSFNLLVPKSGCKNKDLFMEYQGVRGTIALESTQLLDITTSGSYRHGDQPCSTFGVNDAIPVLADLYNEGDALFFANTGVLQKPVTKKTWESETDTPLFAHNSQQDEAYKVDIESEFGETGILGRMLDVLKVNGYKTSAATVDVTSLAATGIPEFSNHITELSSGGQSEFGQTVISEVVLDRLPDLNGATALESSVFGETWSETLLQSISDNRRLVEISQHPEFDLNTAFPSTSIGNKFAAAAKWIKARDFRKVSRDGIFISQGGYDHHAISQRSNLELLLQAVNDALKAFITELKDQGVWENTVIVTASDFGRTLTPNSGDGTDHAWGGNYAMIGGSVNGGKILGEFPDDLTVNGPLNIGRGRLYPTTPWDGIWLGVNQFMGLTSDGDLDFVLPNRHSFNACQLYPDGVTFMGGTNPPTCESIIN